MSWRYYGGGFNDAVAGRPNAFCGVCNPMQYATSIMANPAVRTEHTKDVVDFFANIATDTLPAVSFVKPSEFVDGHPLTSKLDLFEAFVKNIVEWVEARPDLFAETAILVTFDESGGFYDSGFIQPVDFFGDGPRVPLLAISPHARGGRVVHTYYDHVSILKFIERNYLKNRRHRTRALTGCNTPHRALAQIHRIGLRHRRRPLYGRQLESDSQPLGNPPPIQ